MAQGQYITADITPSAQTTGQYSAADIAPPPQDAGFFATIGKGIKEAPQHFMDFVSGHPLDQIQQTLGDLTTARKQHQQRAADAYQKGDYKEAFHQLMFSIPVIGPPAGAAADEIQNGQPGQGAAHAVEALVPWIAPELSGEGFARIADAPGMAINAVKGTAGKAADLLTSPLARDVVGIASPRAAHVMNLAGRVKKAAGAISDATAEAAPAAVDGYKGSPYEISPQQFGTPGATRTPGKGTTAPQGGGYIKYGPEVPPDPQAPAPVAVTETPGQSLARSIGSDWEKLSADDRMTLEHAAKAQQNAKATPPPPVAPQPAPPAPVAAQAAPAQNFTIQDLLQQEMAARQSQAAPAPAAVSGPMIGAHDTTPLQAGKAPPLRPPMAQAPQPAPAVSPAPTQAPMPPPKPSMAQLEAWMAQKKPAPLPSAQSSYNPDGSRMSPHMRGEVVKGANVTAKAQRYAQALFDEGITHEDVSNMTAADRAVVNQGLIAKGRLEPGENPPDESRPLIIWNLKKLQAAKYAADLKAEMEASGTLAK